MFDRNRYRPHATWLEHPNRMWGCADCGRCFPVKPLDYKELAGTVQEICCPECGSDDLEEVIELEWNEANGAEWLTKFLFDGGGARSQGAVQRAAERRKYPWYAVLALAKRLGFIAEDRWRLPDDHPYRRLFFS